MKAMAVLPGLDARGTTLGEMQEADRMAARRDRDLRAILGQEFGLTPFQVLQAEAFQHNMKAVDLVRHPPQAGVEGVVPAVLVRRHRVIPMMRQGGTLVLAVADADIPPAAVQEIEASCGLKEVPVLAAREQVEAAIDRFYPDAG